MTSFPLSPSGDSQQVALYRLTETLQDCHGQRLTVASSLTPHLLHGQVACGAPGGTDKHCFTDWNLETSEYSTTAVSVATCAELAGQMAATIPAFSCVLEFAVNTFAAGRPR